MHSGKITGADLDREIILKNYKKLESAIDQSFLVADGPNKTAQQLMKNTFLFSGAKNAQEMIQFSSLLVDDNGKIRNKFDFKKEILKVHKTYDINHLDAEYHTALAGSTNARDWERFQRNKDRYPHLKYMTLADDHVRDDHQPLHEIVKHIDDSFWDVHFPPNGWRCRCYVTQTKEKVSEGEYDIEMDTRFQHNPGKSKKVFINRVNKDTGEAIKHPYFQLPSIKLGQINKLFELNKELNPQYIKSKFKGIQLSKWASPGEVEYNLKFAKSAKEVVKETIYIRPDINLKRWKNPELLIGKLIGDIKKTSSKTSFHKRLEDARRQRCKFIVWDIQESFNNWDSVIKKYMASNITVNRNRQFNYFIFVKNGKAIKLSKEDMIKNNFDVLDKLK